MLIAAALLAIIALAFAYPHFMVSPGPLVAGHRGLTTDCFACHSPWHGADSRRCIQCHAVAGIGVRTTKGVPVPERRVKTSFHQELIEQDCMACHSDHQGSIRLQRSRKPFSHALLREATRDRCQICHSAPRDAIHSNLNVTCSQCHASSHWKPATFDHDTLFLLDRDHNTDCTTCHTGGDFSRYTCYGCHEHQQDRVRAEHLEEGIRDFSDCVKCHRSAREEPGRNGSRGGRERD